MAKDKKWIQSMHMKRGAFTAQAKAAGKSVGEYAQEKKGAAGKTGARARLALALRKISAKRKKGGG
jgi:hypothetical protein